MALNGNPVTITFTPAVAGKLIVTCNFDAQRTAGSDWGTGAEAKVFMTQNGSTVYGNVQRLSTSRIRYSLKYAFDIAAGLEVVCGLYGGVSGASTVSFWNSEAIAEHVKK